MEPQPESSDRESKRAWAEGVIQEFEQARVVGRIRAEGSGQGQRRTLLWVLLGLIVGLGAGALWLLRVMLPQVLGR